MTQDDRYKLMFIMASKNNLYDAVVEKANREHISQEEAYYSIYYRIKAIVKDYEPYSDFDSFKRANLRRLRKKGNNVPLD